MCKTPAGAEQSGENPVPDGSNGTEVPPSHTAHPGLLQERAINF